MGKDFSLNGCYQDLVLSAVIAFLILIVTYVASNYRFPLSSEKTMLQWFSHVARPIDYNMIDSVILINTHYDKQMLMEYHEENDSMIPIGHVAVSNRKHLRALLDYLKDKEYRYIMLDLPFDNSLLQLKDTNDIQLYSLICSMSHIGFARDDKPLALTDSKFSSKAGYVNYYVTAMEGDFVKYPYIINGEKSLPLKMYEDLTNREIPLFWDGGLLDGGFVRSSAILTFDVTYDDIQQCWETKELTSLVKDNFKVLDERYVREKYIIIGDFKDDVHSTYFNLSGEPGPVINFNAYLSLLKGHYKISIWIALLLFLTFWFLAYRTLKQSAFSWLFMWIGYPAFLIVLCFIIYLICNEVYDVLITTILFYFLKSITDCIRNKELIKTRMQQIKIQIKKEKDLCVKYVKNLW